MSRSSVHAKDHLKKSSLPTLTLAALGVVYGDIGTSPLYALKECFNGHHALILNESNILGILSLIFWSLILVISIKYLIFVMRADNKGEGGILALMALAHRDAKAARGAMSGISVLGLFGAALLYGDGMITPAISVISAVEGLKIATPFFTPYIVPITVVILTALFLIQNRGTAKIGKAFGPIILVWFIVLGVLGLLGIQEDTHILSALNPYYALHFFWENSWKGVIALGSVFLVVTGGEALYADMGHFGRRPIQWGWFCVALPALVLQYFGQGALLLRNPEAIEHPFFFLAPSWAIYPLVILSTAATVIASQALITGAFSLSQQAIQLGFLPRMEVKYTSAKEMGQIYLPFINWALLLGTLMLVLQFQSSARLASAYGIAVTGTMLITTLLLFVVLRYRWKWPAFLVFPLTAFFVTIDLGFFGANVLKFFDGGWVPITIGAIILLLMATWKQGRTILAQRLIETSKPLQQFLSDTVPTAKARIPGTAVFMTATSQGTPAALVHNTRHNQVIHEYVLLLTLQTTEQPYVAAEEQIATEDLGQGFYRVVAQYGFMDTPDVPELIQFCSQRGLPVQLSTTTFFLGRETIIATTTPGMAIWREKLFAVLARNAQRATDFFQIPSEQAIEIGTVIEM